ncbi:MAG: DUF3800 domain-containing protein [Bacteroidota bacterium]
MEYIIFCDESDKKGRYYSNFYGGALVRSTDIEHIKDALKEKCDRLNLYKEIKWSKVTPIYLEKYKAIIDEFFSFIEQDKVKIRIMFTQNAIEPKNLTKKQIEDEYFILYYQFLHYAFGLEYSNKTDEKINLRIYLDHMPETIERRQRFKEYLKGVEKKPSFRRANLKIRKEDITEVKSHDHIILQCLDIILGSMSFRLNNKHLIKPEGKSQRGKKTIAKEKLYKHILKRIRQIYSGFNIGTTTGHHNGIEDRWNNPYRHWRFLPKEYKVNDSKFKP